MQDLAISGTSDFKTPDPLIIVLEHGITRAPKSKFVLGPQISLSAGSVCSFGIFEYE